MVITSKIVSIGVIVLSLAAGIISYYLFSELQKEEKKKHVEELISQLINFIIFIWLGKILLNLSIFIKDPLAILAYPSDSSAFYIAVLFSAVVLLYKSLRKQFNVYVFIESFLHVFLMASFLYEFIQFIWNNNTYAFGYLVLLAVLLVLFFIIRGRITSSLLIMVMLTCWSAGMLVLTFIQPFVTVFGYIMKPWFTGLFFVISFSLIMVKQRRRN